MAARENQGMQAALIVLVVLCILLFVTTFMFYSRWDEEVRKIAENDKTARDANAQAAEYLEELKAVKTHLGVPPTDPLKIIEEQKKKDFEQMSPGMADDQQNYRSLAKQLHTTLAQRTADIIAAQEREKKLGDKIKTDETAKVTEVKNYKTNFDQTADEYTKERKKLTEDVEKAASSKTDVADKLAAARKQSDGALAAAKADLEKVQAELKKVKETNQRMAEKERQTEEDYEVADGRVRWVSQAEQTVWLDKGSADGLHQLTTFKVIDQNEPNPASAPTKGTIEVTRITGGHAAEARIVSDDPVNPILPGDVVFSTAWQPGRPEHFALIDFMDVDGDRRSDRELIKRLITVAGGIIDAEVTDEGKLVGNVRVGTKYLIRGDQPTEKNLSPELINSRNRILKDAEDQGVKLMPLDRFLDYVGYTIEQKTVALDGSASPADFKAKLPDVPRKSVGKTIDFAPQRPKPKNTQY
jgi:hypothetical protein